MLSQNLSPLVVETVRARARAWAPKQAPENANVVTIQDPAWQAPQTVRKARPLKPPLKSSKRQPIPSAKPSGC